MQESRCVYRLSMGLAETYEDGLRYHTLQMAAVLSHYFVPPLFPCLILLALIAVSALAEERRAHISGPARCSEGYSGGLACGNLVAD
jgi:hypothetical protein